MTERWWPIAVTIWGVALVLRTTVLSDSVDFYSFCRMLLRLVIMIPVATILSVWAVNFFDSQTHGEWMEHITNETGNLGSKIACGLVLGSLIYGVFWLCVQV
jgi:hypothetical protein